MACLRLIVFWFSLVLPTAESPDSSKDSNEEEEKDSKSDEDSDSSDDTFVKDTYLNSSSVWRSYTTRNQAKGNKEGRLRGAVGMEDSVVVLLMLKSGQGCISSCNDYSFHYYYFHCFDVSCCNPLITLYGSSAKRGFIAFYFFIAMVRRIFSVT